MYNIADKTPLSTNEIVRSISLSCNKKAKLWFIPQLIMRGITKFGSILKLPLNSERLKKLTESYEVSNDKLISAIGKDLPVDSKEGLRYTLQSFR